MLRYLSTGKGAGGDGKSCAYRWHLERPAETGRLVSPDGGRLTVTTYGRLRARLLTLLAVACCIALPLSLSLAIRASCGDLAWLLIFVLMGALLPWGIPLLCVGVGRVSVGRGRFVHSRTLSGPRRLDLAKISRVRRYTIPGKFGRSVDVLIAKDSDGVRLGITDAVALGALNRAVERSDRVKVSRKAQRSLDGRFSVVADALVPMAATTIWTCVVTLVSVSIAFGGCG